MSIFTRKLQLLLTSLLLIVSASLVGSAMAQTGTINWNDWNFSYEAGADRSGLVLRDVSFQGNTILKKVSFPVMRVRYDNDVCGPYADILSSFTFRPATQGAPNSACDDKTLCERTFTQNGQEVLELGINSQIGEYQLYQSYYFTPDGGMDSRIFSRGLQCVIDHDHHAYWLFDFDIGDSDNDEVRTNGTILEPTEFNDRKGASQFWSVQDTITGEEITITPSADDGTYDSYSQWDVAVRRAKEAEMGRWTYGAYGEIGNLFNEGEDIVGENLVMWYASHMRHLASEGEDLWHASGPSIQVVNVSDPEPEPEPEPNPQTGNNLLSNPSFSNGQSSWSSCSSTGGIAQVSSAGANISNGGCLYQTVDASAGQSFSLSCEASREGSAWTSVYLSFDDSSWNTLSSDNTAVTTTDNNVYTVNLTSPANTRYGVVVLYSEDTSRFDDCILTSDGSGPINPPINPPTGGNLITNGGFESGLSNWQSCANAASLSTTGNGTDDSQSATIQNAGCMYQEVLIEAGQTYSATCDGYSDGSWTTMLLALMDNSYNSLSDDYVVYDTSYYEEKSVNLTAPNNGAYAAVVLYSEGIGNFDNCRLFKQ